MHIENIYNRRRFFKKSLGMVVPMLSMIVLGAPMTLADSTPTNNCNNSCVHTCSYTCNRDGCTATCATSCLNTCKGSCKKACDTACLGSCGGICKGSCTRACGTGCDGKCIGGSRSEVPVSRDSISYVPDTIKNSKEITK